MRPYLAIIKDSFREAFATKILWVTLASIALFLLLLVPIGFDEDLATQLREGELQDLRGLVTELSAQGEGTANTPGKHLWSLLTANQRKLLSETNDSSDVGDSKGPPGPGGRRMRQQRLLELLNDLVRKDDMYDAEAWASLELSNDLKSQATSAAPGSDQRKAVNRRLLAAAYPRLIILNGDEAVYFKYLWMRLESPLPIPPAELPALIRQVLATLVSLFFGWIGILVSILVTATIIPRTFEPGEITLLLSKPVSRSLLFLARFAGGCAFTFVNVAFLLVGLWLVAGLRFDIWNHRLLLGIPIYVFLFAVYFSVSALVGVRWGNAIIAVCFAVAFSLFLRGVYVIKGTCELFLDPQKITAILSAGDELLVVTAAREVALWNAQESSWKPVFGEVGEDGFGFHRRIMLADSHFSPRYDARQDRIIALKPNGSWISNEVLEGKRSANWLRQQLGRTTDGILELEIDQQGRIICIGTSGLYEFVPGDPADLERQEILEAASGGFWKPAARTGTRAIHTGEFERIRREDSAAMHPVSNDIVIYRAGTLSVYRAQADGLYSVAELLELSPVAEGTTPRQAVIGFGRQVVVCYDDGTVEVPGADRQQFDAFDGDVPKLCVVSPDARYVAVLSHTGKVWLYDSESQSPVSTRIPAQGSISGVAFSPTGELFIADNFTRVREFDVVTGKLLNTFAPRGDWFTAVYHWGVSPLYWALPKPAELDTVVSYLMTDKESEVLTMGPQSGTNLQQERISVDIWSPIWSSLAFVVVMLALSCWHISARDF